MASGAAASGLAGCASDEPDDSDVLTTDGDDGTPGSNTTPTDESGGGTPVTTELTFRAPVSWTPGDSNINLFSTQGDWEYWVEYMWWEALAYPNNTGDPMMWLADDIRLEGDGCDVVIEMRDDYTWWDGTPVTARDMYTSIQITGYVEYGSPDAMDSSWSMEGDYTLRNTLSGPANPGLKKASYFSPIVAKDDYYREWLDKFQDASGEDAVKSVAQDLNKHKVSIKDLTEKGLGCGMWKPTQWGPTEIKHEKYADHPRADWTNLETLNWVLMADKQKSIQALQSGRFDLGDKLLTQAAASSNVEVFSQFPKPGVPKLVLNFNDEHLERRPVRRALAYLVDHEELVKVIKGAHGQFYKSHRKVTGMSSMLNDKWLSDDVYDNLIDYGKTAQPEKARQILEDAGYSKPGETWVGPDGKKIKELQYLTPPWPIYVTIGKYFSPKLKEFGIPNKLVVPSSSGFWKNWTETWDFDLANWFTYATHPASAFGGGGARYLGKYQDFVKSSDSSSQGCSVDRSVPELTQERSDKLNHPIRPQFPTEVGAMELQGEGQTLQPFMWPRVMAQSQDDAEVRELTGKLVWFHNWQVPHIGFYEETSTYWGDTENFHLPKPRKVDGHTQGEGTVHEHRSQAMEYLAKGHINAKTE